MAHQLGRVAVVVFLSWCPHFASAQPSDTSRLHWVTNGVVRAAAVHEQTLYIGGSFTRVAPAANFLGPWFGVSASTGAALPRLPLADAAVLAIEPDEAGGFFVGGRFTRIGGVARPGLAHVLSDGTVDSAFAPVLLPRLSVGVPEVRALAGVGSLLYVGGAFQVGTGAQAREALVVLNATTGADVTSFPAELSGFTEELIAYDGRVYALGVGVTALDGATGSRLWLNRAGPVLDGVVVGDQLVIAGRFVSPALQSQYLTRLHVVTGTRDTSWNPITAFTHPDPFELFPIRTMTALSSTVFLGGGFTSLNGQPRARLAAVDVAQGTLTAWAPQVDGSVNDLAPASTSSLYVAGAFRRVAGVRRDALAEIDVAGAITAWSPQAYSTEVRTLSVVGPTVLAGGQSAVAGGMARENLAAFDLGADDVLAWAPTAASEVLDLATNGVNVYAGLSVSEHQSWMPGVVAFDAATGASAAWAAPHNTHRLLGVRDDRVYLVEFDLFYQNFARLGLVRVDAQSGALDTSWKHEGSWDTQLRSFGDVQYAFGGRERPLATFNYRMLEAIHAPTGEVRRWTPQLSMGSSDNVLAVAPMGRTLYVAHDEGGLQRLSGFDTESGLRIAFPATTTTVLTDLAVADGLVFIAGVPTSPDERAAAAFRPDGVRALWNPALVPTDGSADALGGFVRQRRWPVPVVRLLTSPTDVIVLGVQGLDGVPVHGVAVYARQLSPAPSSLDAVVVDHAIRFTWTSPQPSPASFVVEAGSSAGASNLLVQDVGGLPRFDATAPFGTYFVRVRAAGAAPGAPSAPTNEIAMRVGCTAPPPPPTRLAAQVTGLTVTLTWEQPVFMPAVRTVIEAGSAIGRTNLARLVVAGTDTSFSTDAPPGTYFVRLRSENACGTGAATSDVWFTVGGGALPAAPTGVTITDLTPHVIVGPHDYVVTWSPVAGATAYVLEVGSAPGLSDLIWTMVAGTSAGPAGAVSRRSHYVRVRAVNGSGVGPPGAEYVLVAR